MSARRGAHGELVVTLRIAPGFHVVSERPSRPSYIATRVSIDTASALAVIFGEPVYPPATIYPVDGEPLAVFEGNVEVRVPFDVEPGAPPGPRQIRGSVRYQACTAGECLFPRTLGVERTLQVLE
jgi:hypothetical protein